MQRVKQMTSINIVSIAQKIASVTALMKNNTNLSHLKYESGRSNISVSDYVLVKFVGKKSFIYYVGQIENKNTESKFSVKYIRKKADCSKFIFLTRLIVA